MRSLRKPSRCDELLIGYVISCSYIRWLTELDCRQPKYLDDFKSGRRLSSASHRNNAAFVDTETPSSPGTVVGRSSWPSTTHANDTIERVVVVVDDSGGGDGGDVGNDRRRLWVAAPGIMAARRSLPTPTMITTSSGAVKSFEDSRSTTATTGMGRLISFNDEWRVDK